ncbi:2'-5' RNA ligase family protein [Cystobacter ferrugineus]|uniref:Phosphoesterase HXTX n=1 Tax=Cystobacter ferrugineus TaxID=83449 RepID=A0A1L9B3J3_9BACT|nr:2'-5' RNA ligase family protein [Cystobacter ferrugineus]OJH36832.1 phosphoesterase HXTX [Cystobacter ferrugineus]
MEPLIVTLKLDADTFARFDRLRREHFPTKLNHLSAHLTLFHHLPGEERGRVEADLRAVAPTAAVELQVTGLCSLGRGVAFELASPPLNSLRAELARRWPHWLTPQDRQGFRPHVTVQNKVTPEEARALKALLTADFSPFTARGEGFQLWRYLNGPWALEAEVPFLIHPV